MHFLSPPGGVPQTRSPRGYLNRLLCGHRFAATFIDRRRRIKFRELSNAEKAAVIAEDPLYGRVICRCETVTEGEIVEAIHRSIDAIKRRCNAGMGRCQGGFCGPRVHEILARELCVSPMDITMDEEGTWLLSSPIKEVSVHDA